MPVTGPNQVLYEKWGEHVAIITMNRPERMNSSGLVGGRQMTECFNRAVLDDDIWVIIRTAAGDRSFGAGADLRERADLDATVEGGYLGESARLRASPIQPLDVWKPIIAAIQGYCIAGGWAQAQKCDVRIAEEHAEFGIAEVRWNLCPPWTAQTAQMIPLGILLEVCLWGARRHSAQRMYEVGFVNKVVPKGESLNEAKRWAEEILEMGPMAVRKLKELIYRSKFPDLANVEAFTSALADHVRVMEDAREGPRAFAEKRKPVWKLK